MSNILDYDEVNAVYRRYSEVFGAQADLPRPLYKQYFQGMASHALDKYWYNSHLGRALYFLDKSADFSGRTYEGSQVTAGNFTECFGDEIADGTATKEDFDKILDYSAFQRLSADIGRYGQFAINPDRRDSVGGCNGSASWIASNEDGRFRDLSATFSSQTWGSEGSFDESYVYFASPRIQASNDTRGTGHWSYERRETSLTSAAVTLAIPVDSAMAVLSYYVEGWNSGNFAHKYYSIVAPLTKSGDSFLVPPAYLSVAYLEQLATNLGFAIPVEGSSDDVSLEAILYIPSTFVITF